MVANTGTYLDTPFHRFPDGHDLAGLDLARVVDLPGGGRRRRPPEGPIRSSTFAGLDLAGRAVLVRTGWYRHWRDRGVRRPLRIPTSTAGAADALVAAGAALVGIDSVNIDVTTTGERPVHTALLAPASRSSST